MGNAMFSPGIRVRSAFEKRSDFFHSSASSSDGKGRAAIEALLVHICKTDAIEFGEIFFDIPS
ncbi:MAG: hypothetical protein A2V88_11475 [Elusimicrobia bacterium RBG_16_66_12]|nr:MAG: hypothetical protein A2V88_11475 [Elusimicrobia bacterium RBG_16_66_12]